MVILVIAYAQVFILKKHLTGRQEIFFSPKTKDTLFSHLQTKT